MVVASSQDPCLAVAPPPQVAPTSHQPQAPKSWADMMDGGSPEMPPIFEDLLELDLGGEEAEGNANSDLLAMGKMEEVQSMSSSTTDAATAVESNLYEVCK